MLAALSSSTQQHIMHNYQEHPISTFFSRVNPIRRKNTSSLAPSATSNVPATHTHKHPHIHMHTLIVKSLVMLRPSASLPLHSRRGVGLMLNTLDASGRGAAK